MIPHIFNMKTLYICGLLINTVGLLLAVWLAAINVRRAETRAELERLISQSNRTSDVVLDAWLGRPLSEKSMLQVMQIESSLERWEITVRRVEKRLGKKLVEDNDFFSLHDFATMDIEDRERKGEEACRRRCHQFEKKLQSVQSRYMERFEGWRYKLAWW